jgi:RNA polymerase sigma factor (sigma-70 family)
LKNSQYYKDKSDQELLENYRIFQNREVLGILLQRYTILLLGVCIKYLKNEEAARDAVQQIFTKVITELDKYPVTHFKSWLYTIARNYCFMQLRHKTYNLPESSIDADGNHYKEEFYFDTLQRINEKEQLLKLLEDSLHELQPNQRECISLFYLDNMSYQRISERTGYSLLQIKSYIQNGKRNIKQMIEKRIQRNESQNY